MYRVYQVLLMKLKLDIFFIFGFCVQLLVLVVKPTDPEFWLTLAGLPLAGVLLYFTVRVVRNEDYAGTRWVLGGWGLVLAYLVYKLVIMWEYSRELYFNTRQYLTLFGICKKLWDYYLVVLSMVIVVGTEVMVVLCYRNYGMGLKKFCKSFFGGILIFFSC